MERLARVALACLLVACAPQAAAPSPGAATVTPTAATASASAGAPAASSALPTATPRRLPHVFVIVMENTGLQRALAAPTIAALASRFILATAYHAVARPSLPNYLAMTSGSTWGITDDAYHVLPATGIGAQLTAAGIPWRAYMEGMTGTCMNSPYPYALKHDPFAYYGGVCPENVVPLERLDADLAGDTPRLVWITPGLCHDAHDCPVNEAGVWLDALVVRIVASEAWRQSGVLFIVWDEGNGGDENLVPLIFGTSATAPGRTAVPYDHYSLLATIEDLFGLPRLGNATDARPIADVFPR